jgi:hypothetical protein
MDGGIDLNMLQSCTFPGVSLIPPFYKEDLEEKIISAPHTRPGTHRSWEDHLYKGGHLSSLSRGNQAAIVRQAMSLSVMPDFVSNASRLFVGPIR